MKTVINNAKICTPDGVVSGCIILKDDVIEEIVPEAKNVHIKNSMVYDTNGAYVMPGFIDTHSDHIESEIQPRPTSVFSIDLAFRESEKKLLNQGITTMFHSLSLYNGSYFGENKTRSQDYVEKIAQWIKKSNTKNSLIHHKLHIRYEIDNLDGVAYVIRMLQDDQIDLISFMDHTPGQGQFRDLETYKDMIVGYGHVDEKQALEILKSQLESEKLDAEAIVRLADIACGHNVPIASHDDDTEEKLDIIDNWNVDICEFPISLEVAKSAKKRNHFVSVGSPNILLGGSHSGNLSAAEAIINCCADILCSDYKPSTILHSIFYMNKVHDMALHEMVNLATINPAKAVHIDSEYGSIELGKKADLLQVRTIDGDMPVIEKVWIDGKLTSTLNYCEETA